MDSDKLTKMFAKVHLLEFNDRGIQVLECVLGIAESFYQSLFELYYKADYWNKMKLRKDFLEFVDAIKKYNNEPEYFEMKYTHMAE